MGIKKEIKQKKFASSWEKALVNLHYTSHHFTDQMLFSLKKYNINDQHYNILRILRGRYPESANPGDIKSVLINKRGDLTRLTDKLCKLTYVERSTNPHNRRLVDIKITKNGLHLLTQLDSVLNVHKTIQDRLTKEEAEQLSMLLDKIRG